MIATASKNTMSLMKEETDASSTKAPTSPETAAERKCCEVAVKNDEKNVFVELKMPIALEDRTLTSVAEQINLRSSTEDESESSVSALTPEGALIREMPIVTEAGKEFAWATPATTKEPVCLNTTHSTSATEDVQNGLDASLCDAASANHENGVPLKEHNQQQQRHTRQVIYAACQSILVVMRADPRYVSPARFTEELSVHELYGHNGLHLSLQRVMHQMQTPSCIDDKEDGRFYLDTFCEAVRRQDVSAAVTGAVLSSLYKLVALGLVDGSLDKIADSLVHCAFEETTTPLLNTTLSEAASNAVAAAAITATPHDLGLTLGRRRTAIITQPSHHNNNSNLEESRSSSNGNADDERVVLKLLQLCVLIVETDVVTADKRRTSQQRLTSEQITALMDTCWHVRHKAATATPLLKSVAEFSSQQIISAVFSAVFMVPRARLTGTRCQILLKLSDLLVVPNEEDTVNGKATVGTTMTTNRESIAIHSLTQLMTIMEAAGLSFELTERDILERVIARDVVTLAMRTVNCTVLQLCCRVVHQLLNCLHLQHLKCELEVFIHVVYLRRLEKDSTSSPGEQEVILDSLLGMCYGDCAPMNLYDLYLNYDCDNACTNLFELVVTALARAAHPANWTHTPDAMEESRKKSTPAEANIALSANSVHSTASQSKHSLEASADSVTPIASYSTSVQSAPVMSQLSKPVQIVTVVSRSPLNHLNRLALEGILSVLEMIATRCSQGKSSICSNTVSSTVVSSLVISSENLMDDNDYCRSACLGAEGLTEDVFRARMNAKTVRARVVQAFNDGNPDKGEWLKVAVAEGLLQSTKDSKAVADFLSNASEDLDKRRLGIYLSRGPDKNFPFQASVRNCFAAIQDFSDLLFAAALRKFLSKFRLPGEAQCIDRLMEAFSKEFFNQQKCGSAFFKNADAVYVLAFSTIMLNTDLHNPTIKAPRRMTKEQFVKNNRGINGGEDLPENFISDLYDQIKGRELQVRPKVNEFMRKDKKNYAAAWESVLEKKGEIAHPVRLLAVDGKEESGRLDKELFLILANTSVHAITGIFIKSWDDALVVRTLRGLQQIVELAVHFELDRVVNDVLQILLPQGRDYILNCITLDLSFTIGLEGGASVETPVQTRHSTAESEDDTTIGAEHDQLIPFGLLCSSDERGQVDISGSATNRGLLALDSSFVLLRKNSNRVTDAWPAFIECLCALRDARALPAGLSDLDDFADSNGNVLPLSSFARTSQKRLDDYHRSLSDKDTSKNKGWFRSFFRKGKSEYHCESTLDDASATPKGELSVYAKTLLGVAEGANVENIVQMGSSQLPEATIRTLLNVLDSYPFENDPLGEQHAVFTLELAARALLSNRERAEDLFMMFLSKFESILCKVTDIENDVPAPFVIERIVVTILRSSIHLYEYSELRPHLRASLQLLMMTLPRSFIRAIADRMACGLAIILRASFHFFETYKEWSFMGDTLDVLANYSSSRVFVFDGIASTVEYALPNANALNTHNSKNDALLDEEDRPQLTKEACSALSRILTRFVLGFYQGDLSLTVPAMLCLEKVYRCKVEILLRARSSDNSTEGDRISYVPDMELWQNVAVAVYSVCRNPDPETSTEGMQCYRRIVLRTAVDQIPSDKWVAIIYLMVNKQPPLVAEISRGNTFSVLGHVLTRVIPSLSRQVEHREDLEELINQYAAMAEENLRQSRRGQLFEKTLQTLTYLSNQVVSDDWDGEKGFSAWMSKIILKELERAGKGAKLVTIANTQEAEDVSEISDSVADYSDNDIVGSRR